LVTFLAVFAKLRKAIISFVISVHLSVCPHRTTLYKGCFARRSASVDLYAACRGVLAVDDGN